MIGMKNMFSMTKTHLLWAVFAGCLISTGVNAETYTYDTAGRLTGVSYDDGTAIAYSYDANGNRLARTVTVNAGGGQQDGGGGKKKSGGGGSLGIVALVMLLVGTGLARLRKTRKWSRRHSSILCLPGWY